MFQKLLFIQEFIKFHFSVFVRRSEYPLLKVYKHYFTKAFPNFTYNLPPSFGKFFEDPPKFFPKFIKYFLKCSDICPKYSKYLFRFLNNVHGLLQNFPKSTKAVPKLLSVKLDF